MLLIAETFRFELGRYVVQAKPRQDNPYWLVYIVFRGDKLIGKSFSRPDLGCCVFLDRQHNEVVSYADTGAKMRVNALRGLAKARALSA